METKLTKKQVAEYLEKTLQLFCEEDDYFRPELTHPFRQGDCVYASDGHVLIRIKAKKAGVAISQFKKMDKIDAQKPIPSVGFEQMLTARTLSREDIRKTIDLMKEYEEKEETPTAVDVCGVFLSIDSLSRIDVAMRVFGAEQAKLVWHTDWKVLLYLYNAKGQEALSILHMGIHKENRKIFTLHTTEGMKDGYCFDWKLGMKRYDEIMADLARQEEEERMARREVYMVPVVKRAYIPVYARNAKEAEQLCDKHFIDPEDDGDNEWMVGSVYAPEVEDLDDIEDCYEHVITRDGVVEREKIYEMDKISMEWEEKQKQSANKEE